MPLWEKWLTDDLILLPREASTRKTPAIVTSRSTRVYLHHSLYFQYRIIHAENGFGLFLAWDSVCAVRVWVSTRCASRFDFCVSRLPVDFKIERETLDDGSIDVVTTVMQISLCCLNYPLLQRHCLDRSNRFPSSPCKRPSAPLRSAWKDSVGSIKP